MGFELWNPEMGLKKGRNGSKSFVFLPIDDKFAEIEMKQDITYLWDAQESTLQYTCNWVMSLFFILSTVKEVRNKSNISNVISKTLTIKSFYFVLWVPVQWVKYILPSTRTYAVDIGPKQHKANTHISLRTRSSSANDRQVKPRI